MLENQKFKLNESTLLVINEDTINSDTLCPLSAGYKHYVPVMSPLLKLTDVINNVENFINYISDDNDAVVMDMQYIKCRLYFSSEIDVESAGFFLSIRDRNNNYVTSVHGFYSDSKPMQVFNHKNTLYTTYFDLMLPYDLLDENLQFYVNNNIYVNQDGFLVDNSVQFSNIINPAILEYESLKTDIISDVNVGVNLEINSNKFLQITPYCIKPNKTIKQYLLETLNIEGFIPEISLKYEVNFINANGTFQRFTVSNLDDIYGTLKIMIDTSDYLVNDINDLPITIYVTMIIELDNFKIHREAQINYNYILTNPNEIVDSLNIANLTSKEVIEKVNVVNQEIVQTPNHNDPIISVVKMETPVYTNILTENIKIDDFNGYLKFSSLGGININNNNSVVMFINGEMLKGTKSETTSSKDLIFNVNNLKNTPKPDTEFKVMLINNEPSNLNEKTQTILVGKII